MDQAGIAHDLLSWLEGHLDQPLSLGNVTAKTGYSKWHLRRMFRDVTGHAIGTHIRTCRSSKSTIALRLTARPILDVTLQYHFDSQQTSTRASKKQFSLTPMPYRRSPDWSSFGMRPPLRLDEFTLPKYEFVALPIIQLLGVTQNYTCKPEKISDFRNQMCVQFWRDLLGNSSSIPPVLYGLHEPRPSLERDSEQEVLYTIVLTPEMANGHLQNAHPVTLEDGEHVMSTYKGPGTGLQEFILTVYDTCMPILNLTCRRGLDIKRFYPEDENRDQATPTQLRCEYLIPICR